MSPNGASGISITANQRIIVIGASTGGLNVLKEVVRNLPPDFANPIFIVWHMSPNAYGVLPNLLNKENTIYMANAYDKEEIQANRIYVAPPDHHLLIEKGRVRVTHGPKENRFRPDVDPLFRSAAYAYSNRVIGVILSGVLDDGTAGLWTIKHHGGTAIVQDPIDAEMPLMPQNAMHEVDVDYCVPVAELAGLLTHLSNEAITENTKVMKDKKTGAEIKIAKEGDSLDERLYQMGELTAYFCPECHGVLAKLSEGKIVRYCCHTGHAYSVDALMASITEKTEDSLHSALRGIKKSVTLLNHVGDHYAEANRPQLAAAYFKKAKEAEDRAGIIRKTVVSHEHLSKDKLWHEAADETRPEP